MVDLTHKHPDSGPRNAPELAVVVLVGGERERAQRTLDAVAAQRAVDRIEAVVVDTRPDRPPLHSPSGLRLEIIAAAGMQMAAAKVRAVEAVRAPLVAFIEDHATPDPAWAGSVIEAFAERPRGAVGYAFRNANPERWVSRAGFIADYLTWAEPLGARVPSRLPCNNCAYARELLLERGDRLEALLGSDVVLQDDLRRSGHELHVERRAVVYHENLERAQDLLLANFHHCRLIASRRVALGRPRPGGRVLLALGALLAVPPLRLLRDFGSVSRRPRLWARFVEALPAVLVVHLVASVGEAIGYLSDGHSEGSFTRFELDVERTVRSRGG